MKSNWTLIKSEKSRCPKCLHYVDLLCKITTDRPAFYICFRCASVAEVGVGPVQKGDADE